ncbi:MAG: glycosyltransferase 87 family protein [Chthoniobacteraceae bacterium]|jgi:hypothetical protein
MTEDSTSARPLGVGRVRWAILLICACGSGWLYRQVARLAPRIACAEPTAAGEVFPWVKRISHHSIETIQHRTVGYGHLLEFMGCCAGLFLLYGVMFLVGRGVRSGWFAALAGSAAAVFMGILLCAPVMFSSDTYAYAYYGRLLGVYGADACAAAPAGSLADPFLCNGLYQFAPSWYGPLWTVISAGLALAGGGHVGLTLLLFRGLEAAAALGCAGLVWAILTRLRPERAMAGMLLFLWNPLVVTESALGGHNDFLMILFVLLAVWLHLRGRKTGAVVALTLSALVKVITGPLIPLYLLMTLHEARGWRERGWLLARAALAAAVVVTAATFAARMGASGVLTHVVSSPGFYRNNYHELVFRALRRRLGEPAGTLDAPMDYRPWWVATSGRAVLHADPSNKSKDLLRLKPRQPLLALSNKDTEEWLRVFDPSARMVGFVSWPHLEIIPAPPGVANDPVVRQLSIPPADWPTVATANRWIRLTTWGLFAAFGLLAAWKTRDMGSFITWGTAFFLAAQLLVVTQIWPWYMIWPLALGALKPECAATRLAVMLSVGFSVYYGLVSYCNTRFEWAYDDRSIFMIILPVALFGILEISTLTYRRP